MRTVLVNNCRATILYHKESKNLEKTHTHTHTHTKKKANNSLGLHVVESDGADSERTEKAEALMGTAVGQGTSLNWPLFLMIRRAMPIRRINNRRDKGTN